MSTVIKLRNATTTQWTTSTRILAKGELAIDTTLNKIKIGDGTKTYSQLPFSNVTPLELSELAQDAIGAAFDNESHSNILVEYNDLTNKIILSTGPDVITSSSLNDTLTDPSSGYVSIGDVGNPDGIATLDSNGKVPLTELGNVLESPTFTGTATTNDLVVDGDFTVNGTNFSASATSITIEDNMLQLAHQNSANTVDLGIVVGYNDGESKHSGLVRDVSDDKWKLFKGVTTEPATTVNFSQGSLDNLAINSLEASSAIIGNVSNTELQYLNGVTGAIQNQLDEKVSLSGIETISNKTILSPTIVSTIPAFYAAGLNKNYIVRSYDGIIWAQISFPGFCYRELRLMNGKLAAIGTISNSVATTQGLVYSNDYGSSWSTVTLPVSDVWKGGGYIDGKYVVVGINNAVYSTDLENWTTVSLPDVGSVGGFENYWNGVEIVNNRMYAYRDASGLYTDNGVDWNTITYPVSNIQNIIYANSKYTLIGTNNAASSTDGLTSWTTSAMPSTGSWEGLGYGNGVYVAHKSSTTDMAYSSDAVTWSSSSYTAGSSYGFSAITYFNGKFIGLTDSSADFIISSIDGVTWTTSTKGVATGEGFNVHLLADASQTISAAEIGYLDGLTSSIQTQLDSKAVYPSQTSNSGKYLTTNGSTTSWATAGGPQATHDTLGTVYSKYGPNSSLGFGQSVLQQTTGYGNAGFGWGAMFGNTSGYRNTGIGAFALTQNATGYGNTAVGNSALQSTTSNNSSAFGNGALRFSVTGDGNSAFGNSSMNNANGGYSNSAFGMQSLYSNVTGHSNSAFGLDSLVNSTGNQNVGIGHSSGYDLISGNNNIAIGYNAQLSATAISNQITLGNSSITTFRIPGLGVNWSTTAYGRATYASTSAPSGGNDGDVWLVYTA